MTNQFTYKELDLIREVAASMCAACSNDGRKSMLDRANDWQSIADKCRHVHAQSGENWLSDKCDACGLDLRNEIHTRAVDWSLIDADADYADEN